jgi:hypothetical protein
MLFLNTANSRLLRLNTFHQRYKYYSHSLSEEQDTIYSFISIDNALKFDVEVSRIRTVFKNVNDNSSLRREARSREASALKLVLIAPPSPYSPHYARLSRPPYSIVSVFDVNPLIPLGPAYVAAAVEAAGFQVEIVDLTFQSQQKINVNRIHRTILDLAPDIVGFSSFTSTIPTVYRLATLLKKSRPSLPLIVGGSHA